MGLNTPFNVTLTEGQIGVILCSLEDSVKKSEHYREDKVKGQSLQPFDDYGKKTAITDYRELTVASKM